MTTLEHEMLARRHHIAADIFTRFKEKRELPDGYELVYPQTPEWEEKTTQFVEMWRPSCPYFHFELDAAQPDGRISLRITGPEGTKQFVDNAYYMLTSYLNPAPNTAFRLRWRFAHATRKLRVLPDFLIIGAKKCGTTSLYAYLTQHPSVVPALKKEIYFFMKFYKDGVDTYRAFFPTKVTKWYTEKIRRRRFLTGEASPEYILGRKAAKRIFKTMPQVKLIAILRNPVDKAYSLYQHRLRMGVESLPFDEAIERELQVARGEIPTVELPHAYLAPGIYAEQLKVWRKYFPREHLLVITNEDLNDAPAQTMAEVFTFLGLEPMTLQSYKKLNAFPYPAMDPVMRARLVAFYRPHNARLYDMLGKDLGWDF